MDHHCPYMDQCIGDRNFKSGSPAVSRSAFLPTLHLVASSGRIASFSDEPGHATSCADIHPNRTVLATYLVRFHILACWGCSCMIVMWYHSKSGMYLRSAAHRAMSDLAIVLAAAGCFFTGILGGHHVVCAACGTPGRCSKVRDLTSSCILTTASDSPGRTLIEMSRIRQLRSSQMVRPHCTGTIANAASAAE
jgi:hypothetical protein